MDATTDTDTNIYLAYGRPVTRQRWVESIAADLAAQCAAGWCDEDDAPTVAELTAALAGLRELYAAAEAAAAH
ncbi:MAG: hypothetical protein ACRCWC_07050 [Plesiomonas shigelloides]